MHIYRDYHHWPDDAMGGVVAIGNFDGIHLGHQQVIQRLVLEAQARKCPAIIICFEPHPRHYFNPQPQPMRVLNFKDKAVLLKQMGITHLLAQRFHHCIATMSAETFIKEVLVRHLKACHVLTGQEFIFGHQRGGNAWLLQQYAQQAGAFSYEAIAPVGNAADGKFSSSKIRDHIAKGEMPEAAAILGRPYHWCRRVIHGEKRGRKLGYATANMRPPPVLSPPFGVYAVRGRCDGKNYQGVANLGIRPTFGDDKALLECHWFENDDDNLYGKLMRVDFIQFIRAEQRFDTPQALKQAIAHDCEQARKILK